MQRKPLPPRKALLVDAVEIPLSGLRDGSYLVTPDMAIYDSIYQRYVTANRRRGFAMPYATPLAASPRELSHFWKTADKGS